MALTGFRPISPVLPPPTFVGWMTKLKGFEVNKDRTNWTSWNASSGVGAPLAVNRVQPYGSSVAYVVSAADPASDGWWEAPNVPGWHSPRPPYGVI